MPDRPPTEAPAELALRASEARYRRLFEAAQDGILLINADTAQIEDANPYVIDLLGYSHAELLGRKLWEVGAFADVARSNATFSQLQHTGYVRYADLPLRTKAGALINVEFVSNAYDCEGTRVIQCNIRNITEQRRAEDELRKLSLVVEQSPTSIVISGLDDEIEYVNEALLRSTGYARSELIGQRLHMLHVEPDALDTNTELRAALALGRIWRGEFLSRRKDGSSFSEAAIVAPIRRPDGNTSHCVTTTVDISQRQRDAKELERYREHLEQLVDSRTRELAAATRAAESANVAKSAFLANMSHEIRTPLAAITGMAFLIRRSGVTPRQSGWLSILESGGQHLLELINAVLDLSKIEAGKLLLESGNVSVGRIVANVVSMLYERAAAKQLRLLVESTSIPRALLGDANRLQQALLNYAVNAIKFTDSGSITLRTRCEDEREDSVLVRFEVQDTGVGIAPEALSRLFSAFEQADNSITRTHGGTGLGLVIVRQLAGLMDGEAGAHSEPGVGSTFWFTARLQRGSQPLAAGRLLEGAAEARLQSSFQGARILLVDDEPVNREVTLELLHAVMMDVDTAEDGAQAVAMAMAAAQPYDLILMDVQMPQMDGLEATRRIRALPSGAATRIIALTANAFAEDQAACLAAGMDGFLGKPFHPDALFQILLTWLPPRP